MASETQKISAYYSLVFPTFTFYIQTLSVTIGRRCNPNSSTASTSAAEHVPVDVDLGALKSVSRLHAKIEYDSEEDRFVLAVIGRNGAWVDGVWSGSGTRAPLGERSQIQIANRIFHFVLPPPPSTEDVTTPSSPSSASRPRSPSVDITSISPPSSLTSHSPPPRESKLPQPPPEPAPKPEPEPEPKPELPVPMAKGKAPTKLANPNPKKRKKGVKVEPATTPAPAPAPVPPPPPKERPRPEDMPPKPTYTYSQLIQKAIKAHDGKATLHEICVWITNEFDYYRYTESNAWTSSIRHNLSSGRAFKKMERCGGDRGKGCFWSVDEEHLQALEEQDSKPNQGLTGSGGKGKKKDKGASLSEPPLKRSIKGDSKGTPLPPPLTSMPLHSMTVSTAVPVVAPPMGTQYKPPVTSGVFSYNAASASGTSGYSGNPISAPNPYATLTHPGWGLSATIHTAPSLIATIPDATPPAPVVTASPSQDLLSQVPNVVLPIILDIVSRPHAHCSADHPNNSTCAKYMALVDQRIVLDPDIFAESTKGMLEDLGKLGAKKAVEVLQGHLSRILAMRKKRKEARAKGKSRPPAKKPPSESSKSIPSVARPLAESGTGGMAVDAPAQTAEADSLIVVVDDTDDEIPASKRRKIEDGSVSGPTGGP